MPSTAWAANYTVNRPMNRRIGRLPVQFVVQAKCWAPWLANACLMGRWCLSPVLKNFSMCIVCRRMSRHRLRFMMLSCPRTLRRLAQQVGSSFPWRPFRPRFPANLHESLLEPGLRFVPGEFALPHVAGHLPGAPRAPGPGSKNHPYLLQGKTDRPRIG